MEGERRTAYLTLMDIEQDKAYSNLALNHRISVSKPKSKAFVRRLVYGVLENRIYLDYIIEHFLKDPSGKLEASERTILRMGLYQLIYMDSIPAYAAVAETVDLAKRYCKGRDGFINAVLRNYLRSGDEIALPQREADESTFLSIKYSYAKWIVDMWLKEYGPEFTEELLAAGNRAPKLTIRVNLLKNSKKSLKRRLELKKYKVEEGRLSSNALKVTEGEDLLETGLYKNGLFSVQDESSMAVVEMLNPAPNEFIIDVCAAPGGKTLYIAERMENSGRIIARDIYKKKLDLLTEDAKRLGITIVEAGTWDAVIADSDLEEAADRVLVDAPCSGLGVIKRKPEIKYKEQDEIIGLPEIQLRILRASSSYVKKGGVLVYSTCTINPAENRQVVDEFLKNNAKFVKEDSVELFPNINDTDGFYICIMKRQ
ncbi:16S rRNA (cytosine(967)-C(5))-methyltransferase RsmB [Bacillota bacterium]